MVSRGLRIAAVFVTAFALVHAAETFSASGTVRFALGPSVTPPTVFGTPSMSSESFVSAPVHCRAALIDAWHAKSPPTGWFGYAPLTDGIPVLGSCRAESWHRLRMAGLALVFALGLLIAAWAVDRSRGVGNGPEPRPIA